MSRRFAALLTVFCTTIAGNAYAEEHYRDWWNFLKGDWTYELVQVGEEGETSYRLAANGIAIRSRSAGSDGSVAAEIGGWQRDAKSWVTHGYGSEGRYWQIEYTKVTAEVAEGPFHGMMSDGRTVKGTFNIKRTDDDHFEWHFEGKADDGEALSMTAKYQRKSQEE